ncbi:MAG: hypothetical protein ACC628_18470, partial [Pirellulaceae bacterium]
LMIRVAACSAVYALVWGVFAFIKVQLSIDGPFDLPWLVVVFPVMIGIEDRKAVFIKSSETSLAEGEEP